MLDNFKIIKKIISLQREVERLNKDKKDDFIFPDEIKPMQRFLYRKTSDSELRPATLDYLLLNKTNGGKGKC